MSEIKKNYFKVPQNLQKMTDEEISEWANAMYEVLLSQHTKEEKE